VTLNYEQGLCILRSRLPKEALDEYRVFEARLLENLERDRLFGSNDTLRSERAAIIYRLNPIAEKHLGVSFNDLCSEHPPLEALPVSRPGGSGEPAPSQSRYTIHIDHAEGIAIGDGARVERGEQPSAPAPPAPPGVSVDLLTAVMPTAYCHHLDAQDFPWITVRVDNTGQGCANSTVRVGAVIEGYSDTAIGGATVPQGSQERITLLPLLRPAAVATLSEIRPATLRITVEQTAPTARALYDETQHIYLHARDTALLAVQAPNGATVDLSRYLAGWVTPRRPEIKDLLRKAAKHHPEQQIVGYQGASSSGTAVAIVREQARAIFQALKEDAGLAYINSTLTLGAQEGQVTQRVRLPTESLSTGSSANCIDGTVLFASLLELASIDPLIVLVPGHAFVGWRVWRNADRFEFLETTMIASDDFETAQQAAQSLYEEVLSKGYFSRGLFDPGGFARLIDVRACRARNIYPLE
jgi:hypothetical protein